MKTFIDPDLGEIVVKNRRGTNRITAKMGTDGRFQVTIPYATPMLIVKNFIKKSKDDLVKIAKNTSIFNPYFDGQQIAKNHKLAVVNTSMVDEPTVKVTRNTLIVQLPPGSSLETHNVQQLIRDQAAKILRKEAKLHLPNRVNSLARHFGFEYSKLKFTHSAGRWGSCSSEGTITLNIALMKLPTELIDYVLAHELSHTRQMNHSAAFWHEVSKIDPLYKLHKQQLKKENPSV